MGWQITSDYYFVSHLKRLSKPNFSLIKYDLSATLWVNITTCGILTTY